MYIQTIFIVVVFVC